MQFVFSTCFCRTTELVYIFTKTFAFYTLEGGVIMHTLISNQHIQFDTSNTWINGHTSIPNSHQLYLSNKLSKVFGRGGRSGMKKHSINQANVQMDGCITLIV